MRYLGGLGLELSGLSGKREKEVMERPAGLSCRV